MKTPGSLHCKQYDFSILKDQLTLIKAHSFRNYIKLLKLNVHSTNCYTFHLNNLNAQRRLSWWNEKRLNDESCTPSMVSARKGCHQIHYVQCITPDLHLILSRFCFSLEVCSTECSLHRADDFTFISLKKWGGLLKDGTTENDSGVWSIFLNNAMN